MYKRFLRFPKIRGIRRFEIVNFFLVERDRVGQRAFDFSKVFYLMLFSFFDFDDLVIFVEE